jgi:hypothetical protein
VSRAVPCKLRRSALAALAGGALTALATLGCGEPKGEGVESLEGIADTLAGDTVGYPTVVEDGAVTAPVDSIDPPALLTVAENEPENWTTGALASQSTVRDAVALLTAVRTGRHADFERVVFELSEQGAGVPAYHVAYIDKPLIECGSGEQVFPVGDAWLEMRMEPLDAHTQEGQPTVPHRPVRTSGLENILALYLTCDFEAVTTLVIAVRSPNPFRAFHLESPHRIVVDVQK